MIKTVLYRDWQKPDHPCLQGKQAGFQEDKAYCQLSENKWMIFEVQKGSNHNKIYIAKLKAGRRNCGNCTSKAMCKHHFKILLH